MRTRSTIAENFSMNSQLLMWRNNKFTLNRTFRSSLSAHAAAWQGRHVAAWHWWSIQECCPLTRLIVVLRSSCRPIRSSDNAAPIYDSAVCSYLACRHRWICSLCIISVWTFRFPIYAFASYILRSKRTASTRMHFCIGIMCELSWSTILNLH